MRRAALLARAVCASAPLLLGPADTLADTRHLALAAVHPGGEVVEQATGQHEVHGTLGGAAFIHIADQARGFVAAEPQITPAQLSSDPMLRTGFAWRVGCTGTASAPACSVHRFIYLTTEPDAKPVTPILIEDTYICVPDHNYPGRRALLQAGEGKVWVGRHADGACFAPAHLERMLASLQGAKHVRVRLYAFPKATPLTLQIDAYGLDQALELRRWMRQHLR